MAVVVYRSAMILSLEGKGALAIHVDRQSVNLKLANSSGASKVSWMTESCL